MKKRQLHIDFKQAVEYINSYKDQLPADILLKLYAYYKIANQDYDNPGSKIPLINAFKANALIQARNITKEQAMERYVQLVDKEIRQKKKK